MVKPCPSSRLTPAVTPNPPPPEWSEPALVQSAPGGVGWVTPQSIQLFANHTAGDIETGAQGNVQTITRGGTVLFTYGKAEASRPGQHRHPPARHHRFGDQRSKRFSTWKEELNALDEAFKKASLAQEPARANG